MTRLSTGWLGIAALVFTVLVPSVPAHAEDASVVISELLASNSATSLDGDGDSSDWIELRNNKTSSIDLSGWTLQDGDSTWAFPATVLQGNAALLVWASGKDRATPGAELHTDFKLKASGERLTLRDPAGTVTSSYTPYPVQQTDVSWGVGASGNLGYFTTPTPGTANAVAELGQVPAPTAESGRGVYAQALIETLESSVDSAQIRYTIDGTAPDETSMLFSENISVAPNDNGIVTIRARAYADGYTPSAEAAWSYVFPSRLYPEDPTVAADFANSPILSVTVDSQALPAENKQTRTAVNLIENDGTEGFSATAGIKKVGTASANLPKNSYRLYFDDQWGVDDLEYPLYDEYDGDFWYDPTETFDKLSLHGFPQDGSIRYKYFLSDRVWKDTERNLGASAEFARYAHLFLNDQYWGAYQIREHPDQHMFYAYGEGGPSENYHTNRFGGDGGNGEVVTTRGDGSLWKFIFDNRFDYSVVKPYVSLQDWIRTLLMATQAGGNHAQSQYRGAGSDDPNSRDKYRVWANDTDRELYRMAASTGAGPNNNNFAWLTMLRWWIDPELNGGDYRLAQEMYDAAAQAFCPGGPLHVDELLATISLWESRLEPFITPDDHRWAGGRGTIESAYRANLVTVRQLYRDNAGSTAQEWVKQGWMIGCDQRPEVRLPKQMHSVVGEAVKFTISAVDPDGDVVSFASTGLPPGLALHSNTGVISGSPTIADTYETAVDVSDSSGKVGYYTITWTVSDTDATPPTTPVVLNEYNAVAADLHLGAGQGADSHFGSVVGNGGDWLELLVTEDRTDLRGWTLELWDRDRDYDDLELTDSFTFSDHSTLANLAAGTLITLAESGSEDLSYEPALGDWVIESLLNSNKQGQLITSLSQNNFDTNRHEFRIRFRDESGDYRGPAMGETDDWRSTGANVGALEVMALCNVPGTAGYTAPDYQPQDHQSTFGAANDCDDAPQNLAAIRTITVLGDLNCDGQAGRLDDALWLGQFLSRKRQGTTSCPPQNTDTANIASADVDDDGTVARSDVQAILGCLVKVADC